MLRIISCVFLLCTFSSCSLFKAVKMGNHLADADFKQSGYYVELPFTLSKGHIALKAKVNGVVKDFFFDTGATTAISPEVTKALKLKTKTYDFGDESKLKNFPVIDSFSMQSLSYTNVGAAEVDMKAIMGSECGSVDGLIGANMMNKSIWQIDYSNQKLFVTDQFSRLQHISGAMKVPFRPQMFTKSPVITIKLENGKEINLVIDTGSNTSIIFNTDDKEAYIKSFNTDDLLEMYSKGYKSILGDSVAETTDTAWIIHSNMFWGNDSIMDQQFTYGLYKNFNSRKNGVIGNEFLKNFVVTIDWNQNVIYFKPVNELQLHKRNAGFVYALMNEKMIVGRIYKNSEAEKTGIHVGTEIIRINDYVIKDLTAAQRCDYYNEKLVFVAPDSDKVTITYLSDDGVAKTKTFDRTLNFPE